MKINVYYCTGFNLCSFVVNSYKLSVVADVGVRGWGE